MRIAEKPLLRTPMCGGQLSGTVLVDPAPGTTGYAVADRSAADHTGSAVRRGCAGGHATLSRAQCVGHPAPAYETMSGIGG
jgi:hypothetical protein